MSAERKEWPVLVGLVPATAIILAPFLWLIISSFKTEAEIGVGNPFALPKSLMWQNYVDAWNVGGFSELIGNSLINVCSVVILSMLVCVPAGYALAKIRFPGREWMFYAFIFGLTIPVQAIIIPLYQVLTNLGLINSMAGVTLAQVSNGVPFGIFLMRSFFLGVPNELTEAAQDRRRQPFPDPHQNLPAAIHPGDPGPGHYLGALDLERFLPAAGRVDQPRQPDATARAGALRIDLFDGFPAGVLGHGHHVPARHHLIHSHTEALHRRPHPRCIERLGHAPPRPAGNPL